MKTKKKKNKALKLLNTLLTVILALMLGATVLAHSLMNKMNRVDNPGKNDPDTNVTVDLGDGSQDGMPEKLIGTEKNIINILLIGQDRREGEGRARSDAMILLTVNKNTKSVVLTSFLRDLYVQIPGYGSNRINASYAFGGMELLNRTLEQNFGIYVDGNVEVDFGQFSEIVDLVGGVEISLRSDEANHINQNIGSRLTEGLCRLNGKEALEYARIRKLDADGDFSRTQRQRTVINALVEQVKAEGMLKMLSIVDDVLPMVTTDMTNTEILGYVTSLLPVLSGSRIENQRIPADGAYSYAMIDGMSVLKPDLEACRQLLRETLDG